MKGVVGQRRVDAFKPYETAVPHKWIEDFILDLKPKL